MQRIKPIKHDKKGFNFKKPNLGIPKIPDMKSLLFGKQPEYATPVNVTSSGLGAASAFLPVKDIRDGIIITKVALLHLDVLCGNAPLRNKITINQSTINTTFPCNYEV
jgi:hypothetical protein